MPTASAPPVATPVVSTPPVQAAASIQYRGIWTPTNNPNEVVTLSLSPLQGQTSISANPVARVEVRVGQATPVVLTAPNSPDGSGRYLLRFDRSVQPPDCEGRSPNMQITIVVTDVTGFQYTKNVATCAKFGSVLDFGAFSDYGTTQAQFSYTAAAPVNASFARGGPGRYVDTLVSNNRASFSASLPAAEGDGLSIFARPTGTRVKARIDGSGGSFAESVDVGGEGTFLFLSCCGPRASSPERIDARMYLLGSHKPSETYSYKLQITDPATGAVLGTQADTIYSSAFIPFTVQRGQVIDFEVTPNTPGANVTAEALSRGFSARISSNEAGTPARLRLFCCTP